MNRVIVLTLVILCGLLVAATSPPDSYYNGIIVLYGSDPLTVPIFRTPYGDFVIAGDLRQYLVTNYQQRKIQVRGRVRAQLSEEYPQLPALEIYEVVGIFQ